MRAMRRVREHAGANNVAPRHDRLAELLASFPYYPNCNRDVSAREKAGVPAACANVQHPDEPLNHTNVLRVWSPLRASSPSTARSS